MKLKAATFKECQRHDVSCRHRFQSMAKKKTPKAKYQSLQWHVTQPEKIDKAGKLMDSYYAEKELEKTKKKKP